MKRHREAFTQQEFKDRLDLGGNVLVNYYDYYVQAWNKIVTTEYRINNVVVNDIPLKGAIDKIEFNGKEVVVIDYKTGNIENAREKLKGPNEKNPNGGDYWRQAVFYKLLLKHHPKNWQVSSAEFDFVEPNKKKAFEKIAIQISDADLTTVQQQVKMVWAKIQEKDLNLAYAIALQKELEKDALFSVFLTRDKDIFLPLEKRVAIARSLANDPEVILADEPTGNLDKQTAFEVMDVLFEYVKTQNAGMILVTHELELANLCDKIYKIDILKMKFILKLEILF
jgi:hypothetical protein